MLNSTMDSCAEGCDRRQQGGREKSLRMRESLFSLLLLVLLFYVVVCNRNKNILLLQHCKIATTIALY